MKDCVERTILLKGKFVKKIDSGIWSSNSLNFENYTSGHTHRNGSEHWAVLRNFLLGTIFGNKSKRSVSETHKKMAPNVSTNLTACCCWCAHTSPTLSLLVLVLSVFAYSWPTQNNAVRRSYMLTQNAASPCCIPVPLTSSFAFQ